MSPTPVYDATLNSDPTRFLWLVGLGPYPGPLPRPQDTTDSAPGTAPYTDPATSPPAGKGQPDAVPGADHDAEAGEQP